MRLDRLDLTRYGRFTDARLNFPKPTPGAPDLHVIFGPNEAGKSTLFAAWLDLLYGIPLRTKYDFQHQGPTMQIGAKLTHAGGTLEAVRLKRSGPSLQDASGQQLPEAVMQSALAGLGREGYAAMFSLDDDTLEQGGESILASRGDLGEMLFAASAGLSGLGPQLEAIRKGLEAFHKPRARNTILKTAKERLQELDRQRRDLDITASAAQKLQRDVIASEKSWATARATETAADAELQAITKALAVLPQQARLARLKAELAPLADLPEATETDERALQDIEQALRGLTGQMETRSEALTELQQRLTSLPHDPDILPLADQIAQATGLHPLHLAALADLPRRSDSLGGVEADLNRRMQALGLDGRAADHTIAPSQMTRLRALIARRDVTVQAITLAQDETDKSAKRLAAAREAHGDPSPAEDLQSLGHLVARLRQNDPEAQTTRAAQDAAARDADLTNALRLLTPWRGTAEDLAALSPPAPWQIAKWDADDQTNARALRDATENCNRRSSDLYSTRFAEVPTATPSLTDAAEARRQRESAWAAHLVQLTPDSASVFETTLRLDDRISLHLAQAMAQAQRAAEEELAQTRAAADLAAAEADLAARHAERQALTQEIAEATTGLGLPGAGVADLRAWLDLRDKALTTLTARDQARAALARAHTALLDATEHLAAALKRPKDLGFPTLWTEALARLDTAAQQQEAARQLAERQVDLAERNTALATAHQSLKIWQQDWLAARSGTTLESVSDQDLGLATLLDDLDTLTRLDSERAELADRIAKMQSNSAAFHEAVASIFSALSLPETTSWTGIADRLAAAQQAERDFTQISADLTRDLAAQAADQLKAEARTATRHTLAVRLACPSGGSLSDHLAACLRATRLRRDIAELEAELAHHPATPLDAEALAAEAALRQDALSLARADSEAGFAELTEARRALQAIGGDDAVARIVAERANLLDELADQTRAHLAQRFGLMAFEQGLRRYRDSHRSTMLARASDAFRQLSRGAYTGLAAQPEANSEVLVALPATGGAKLATDLSKGTRFQLYLALRIAGYHELAKSRPPVPFIADDIMETFDDARSAQAFVLLGEMAQTGQVIYLTHHQHLCEIALTSCPGARMVDLRDI
jgi:uncharacterized protein YhaN